MIDNFVRGVIDGSLSTLGVLIGASAGDISIIISAGLGGTMANGVSNLLGAFSAQKAKKHEELRDLEKAMVDKDLKNSTLEEEAGSDVRKAGLIDGTATILGGVVPVTPFFIFPSETAMTIAISLVLIMLFFLGVYLGRISKENLVLSAIKMVVLGVLVALASYGIQYLVVPVS